MRYSRLLILAAFLLFAAALVVLPAGGRKRISRLLNAFIHPSQEIAALSLRVSREALGGLPPSMTVAERDALLAEAARAKQQTAAREMNSRDLAAENQHLQRLLRHVKRERDYSLVVAEIHHRPAWSDYDGTVLIDRGAADGIQPGQAALTLDGVVGIVASVTMRQATVRLWTAPDFTLPAQIRSRNITALLARHGAHLMLDSPMGQSFDDGHPGDQVFTSDMGSDTMQPGLLIGTVDRLEWGSDGAPHYVVTPAASLENLQYLMLAIPTAK